MALITVEQVRDEGVTEDQADDARIDSLITLSTQFINRATGQFFEGQSMTLILDGNGRNLLHLPMFCAEASELLIGSTGSDDATDYVDSAILYNRTFPTDDRKNPKIRLTDGVFISGYQNISITGIFGYVDINPGPEYTVPFEIQEACKRLVVMAVPLLTSPDRAANENRGRITQENFDGGTYSYTLTPSAFTNLWAGDAYVNQVLLAYRRPHYGGLV